MSVTPMRMMSSPLGMSLNYSTNNPIHVQSGAVQNSGPTVIGGGSSRSYSYPSSDAASATFPDGTTRSTDAVNPFTSQHKSSRDLSEEAYQASANNRHLARIIIAERDLKLRLEQETSSYRNSRSQSRYKVCSISSKDLF